MWRATIVEKLIHRHPHVFGDESAETPEEVKAHWLRTKAAEKQRDSVTEGIPLGQPALALAAKLAGRARTAGLGGAAARREGSGATSCWPWPPAPRRRAPTRRRRCGRRPAPTATRSGRGSSGRSSRALHL